MPGWVTLTNRATGQDELVDSDTAPTAIASGKYLDPGAVAVQRNGLATYTTPDVAQREQLIAPTIDPAQAALQAGHRIREQANTGVLPTAEAFAGGATDALTFGLIDPFQEQREFSPIAGGLGVAAGAIGPALVGDVGGLFGGAREAALGEDALTAERAAGSLSGKAIHTGEAAAGTVERDLVRGAAEVKAGAAAAGAERVTVPTATAAAGPALEDLDLAGLKAAREQELEAIHAAQAPERQAFVEQLAQSRKDALGDKTWIATQGATKREIKNIGLDTLQADRRIDKLLKVQADLAEDPSKALSALRQQEQALTKLQTWGENAIKDWQEEFANAPRQIVEELKAGKIEGYKYDALSQRGIDQAITNVMMERYGRTTLNAMEPLAAQLPTNLRVLESVPAQLERNRALQDMLGRFTAEPTSDRLQAIDSMLADRAAPHEASLGEKALHAISPYLGPVGAVAEKAYAGLRKLVGAAGKKASGAASSFVDTAAKLAPKTPMIATRVLAATAFAPAAAAAGMVAAASSAPPPPGKKGAPAAAASTQDLHDLFARRSQEIRSLIDFDPSGAPVMKADARMALGAKFDAVRAMAPQLADKMETVRARGIEYLASIMPRPVDFGVMQVGPDRRRVSDLEMRSWARAVAAVDDPHGVLERAADGHVVPEEAAAMRAVYPEILDDFTAQVISKLPTLRKNLPYSRRLALSMLTGAPVDPAMTSHVLTEIQTMYAAEPGTAGGTQAPRPQPQFGSVKRQDPGTPAQRRQGMTT